jgi:hypothetical protein
MTDRQTDREDQWLGMGWALNHWELSILPQHHEFQLLIYSLYLESLLINSEENNLLVSAGRLTAIVK